MHVACMLHACYGILINLAGIITGQTLGKFPNGCPVCIVLIYVTVTGSVTDKAKSRMYLKERAKEYNATFSIFIHCCLCL